MAKFRGLTNEEFEKLERSINAYNRVVRKMQKEMGKVNVLLPEKITFNEALKGIESKKGYNKLIKDLELIKDKRQQKIIQVDEDLRIIKYSDTKLKKDIRQANRTIDKEIQERIQELMKISGSSRVDILEYFDPKINQLKAVKSSISRYSKGVISGLKEAKVRQKFGYYGRENLKRVIGVTGKLSDPDRDIKKAERFKENYISMLTKYNYIEDNDKLINAIRNMNAFEFWSKIKDEDTSFINDLTYHSGQEMRISEYNEYFKDLMYIIGAEY